MRTGAAFTAALTFCLGGWFVGLANALGETEAKDCAVAIAGSSVEASSISNVCGVPPELLAAIVEEFTQARKAYQDTNQTLQELADERKRTVEGVRQAFDLTNGQIRAAFEILGERNIPTEQLASKLVEIATKFKDLQTGAQGQPGDTAEIIALRSQAEAAVKAGNLDIADALLAEIDDKQAQFQSDLAANRATTLARRGDVALTRLRYAEAAKHFAEAARTLPPGVEYSAKQRDYLTREASALYRQGDEFGDNAALLAAIERRQLLLKMVPRAALPLDWAKTQNHLGNALASARRAREWYGAARGGRCCLPRCA